MFEKFQGILIFMLFIGPLIFFHELGHFFFARLFKVQVEIFSIGFGPKIFKFIRGGTTYCFSLIPLGGYIKMFGDDIYNKKNILEKNKEKSFLHKGKWARFCIVLGGPLANFIMAFTIFFTLLILGEDVPKIKIGFLSNDSHLYRQGLRIGDEILKINNKPTVSLLDLKEQHIDTLTVNRSGVKKILHLDMSSTKFFEISHLFKPQRGPYVVDHMSNVYKISREKEKFDPFFSLDQMSLFQEALNLQIHPEDNTLPIYSLNLPHNFTQKDFFLSLHNLGLYPNDMLVKKVQSNFPGKAAGILAGDIIVSLEKEIIYDFESLRLKLQKIQNFPITLGVIQKGILQQIKLTPKITDKGIKQIGIISNIIFLPLELKHIEGKNILSAIGEAFTQTGQGVLQSLTSFMKLLTGKTTLSNIAGPLAIGQVANSSFAISFSYFFKFMAVVSLGLGVINLFPIPILDGGHLLFILLELINKKSLSIKKIELAHKIGFSLLLTLMLGSLYNDLSRYFS